MCAIQNSHLTFLVRIHIICPDHVKAGLLQRQFILMLSLDDPQMENLRRIHHIILLSNSFAQSFMLVTRETSYDPVHQCGAEIILILQPALEILSQLPQIRILQATLLQFLSVMIDKLTGQDNKAL